MVKSFNLSDSLFASSDVKWVRGNLPYGLTRELNGVVFVDSEVPRKR